MNIQYYLNKSPTLLKIPGYKLIEKLVDVNMILILTKYIKQYRFL